MASITRKINLRDVGFNFVATAFTQQKLVMTNPKVKIIIKEKLNFWKKLQKKRLLVNDHLRGLHRQCRTYGRSFTYQKKTSKLWSKRSQEHLPYLVSSTSMFLSSDGSLAVLCDHVSSFERCITMNDDDFVISWSLERTKG